jgi:hypothetical protein
MISMTKFNKKIQKITSKIPRFAVTVGDAFGHLEEISELFRTVFVIENTKEQIKKKNIIYIENIDYVGALHDIDVIFVDGDKKNLLKDLQIIWKKYNSTLVIEGDAYVDKFLRSERYQIVQIEKRYHIWKMI